MQTKDSFTIKLGLIVNFDHDKINTLFFKNFGFLDIIS